MAPVDSRRQLVHSIESAMAHLDEALVQLDRLPAFDASAVGFVAHAMNSYLAVSEATLDLLGDALRGHPNQEVATWLEGLRHLASLVDHTVGRLVRVTPPSKFPLKFDHVDLSVLMQRACNYFERLADRKQLRITFRSIGEVPPVWADRVAVAVVADALLANAVEISDPGGIILVEVTPGPGGVVCAVHDQGPGLSPADLARPPRRGAAPGGSPADREPPTGPGLAIAREFIERMGGKLWAESKPRLGTVWSFRLPYRTPEGSGPR